MVDHVSGQKYCETTFPIIFSNLVTKIDVYFLKYLIYVGGNKEMGQIYPNESKST